MAIYNKVEINSRALESATRDAIEEAIKTNASFEAQWVDRLRNGNMDFGALQIMALQSDQNFMRIGTSSASSIVGP